MILKPSAVPDINLPRTDDEVKKAERAAIRADRVEKRSSKKENMDPVQVSTQEVNDSDLVDMVPPRTVDVGVQVDTLEMDKLFIGRRREMAVKFKSDGELNSWTGLSSLAMLSTITKAIETLAEYKRRNHSTVTLEEQILILFIKMKTNISFSCMSSLFNLNYRTVSLTFYRTIGLVTAICEPLIVWPSQIQIKANLPHYFRPNYEDVVAVLDCTEIPIQKSRCLHCKINSYSHYKGHQTAKYLIAVTPGGTISFISRGYGGKCSDKQIVVEEGILSKFSTGEAVMTDKGFLIDKECGERGVKLVRPPFLYTPQLSHLDAMENISIAAARVHVERSIQRVKQFGLFQENVDTRFIPVLDNLMLIACAITNVSNPILSNARF